VAGRPPPGLYRRGEIYLRALSYTATMAANVLLVDDDRDLCERVVEGLAPRGFKVTWKDSAEAALAVLDEADWHVVAADVSMAGMSGIALCERIVATRPNLPVVLITAYASVESAIAAVRAGAFDYVTKPFDPEILVLALDRAVRHGQLKDEVGRLREVVARSAEMDGMIGTSPPMRRVFELIERVAETDAAVLIAGRSGTGKELVARALHNRGRHAAGPFVAVNCAAIPEALLESELFGHVKGAFTDARAARRGLFLKADGGTLFLDEIGDMPLGMQSKLLRVLQEKTVRAVGGDREEPYDARLITATNRDIETEVEQRRFREDLFYRINVIRIDMPPLSARGRDILLLAQHFLARAGAQLSRPVRGLSSAAAAKLLAYGWPGNVRELENCLEAAVAMARSDRLNVDDLPANIRDYKSDDLTILAVAPTELLPLEEVERRHILSVLKAVGGSKAAAAAVLGSHPSTLYRKLDQYAVRVLAS
jgi:two-component system, NtrC family, response regulator AtoC